MPWGLCVECQAIRQMYLSTLETKKSRSISFLNWQVRFWVVQYIGVWSPLTKVLLSIQCIVKTICLTDADRCWGYCCDTVSSVVSVCRTLSAQIIMWCPLSLSLSLCPNCPLCVRPPCCRSQRAPDQTSRTFADKSCACHHGSAPVPCPA